MTAEEILSIKSPTALFKGSDDENTKLFRELAKKYHPDFNPDSNDVFIHIRKLYNMSKFRIEKRVVVDGIAYRFHIEREFELGCVHISDDFIIYHIEDEFLPILKDYDFNKFTKSISPTIKKQFEGLLPVDYKKSGNWLLVQKPKSMMCLYDVLNYFDGRIPGRHLAWITSGLQNMACYLHVAGISHQDISLHNIYIGPLTHKVGLLGAWWYAIEFDKKITSIPVRTYDNMPFNVKMGKRSSHLTDLQLIRTTGLEMMGSRFDSYPKSIVERFKSTPYKNSIDDYKDWGMLLDKLGKRVFVKMGLTVNDLYL